MIRATTPTHTFKFDLDPNEFEKILVTYSQCGVNVLELKKEDFLILEDTINVTLTESQTKLFRADAPVYIQVRATLNGGSFASAITRINVTNVLNDENLIGGV